MARKKTTKIKKEDIIKQEIENAEKGDVMDLVKAREVRLEYISSPEKKTLAHLARMYQVPLEAIKAIAKVARDFSTAAPSLLSGKNK